MAVRKLKQCEAGDGSYGGAVLAAFDMQELVNDFARCQRLAIQLSRQQIAPDTFDDDYRLYPDGFTGAEHRSGKCGGPSVCQYCEAQMDADREAGVCRECGNDPTCTSPHAPECSQHPDNIREAAMCRYCGQDHCTCGELTRCLKSWEDFGSRREAGRKA